MANEKTPLGQPELVMRDGRLVIVIPMRFKRRNGRKEIIVPTSTKSKSTAVMDNPAVQRPMALALSRAHAWQTLLDRGVYKTMAELAEAGNLDAAYVSRTLNLTLLSPDLQRAILRGEEPEGLSLSRLRDAVPWDWDKQVEFLIRGPDAPEPDSSDPA